MKERRMKKERSGVKELLLFSLPLIMSGLLQQLYSWADAFIVGHAGEEGSDMLAGVGATGSITMLLVNSIIGFTLGLSILASQEYGRGNVARIRHIATRFLPVLCVVYVLLTAAAVCFANPILLVMDTPGDIFDHSQAYLQVVLLGVPFLAVYNLFAALLRAVGNTRVAFYAVLLSSVLNVLLDMLLVWGFPFGVVGAASATVVSQVCMTGFVICYTARKYPHLLPMRKCAAADRTLMREGLSFSLPPTIQNSVTSVGNLFLQNFMNNFGAVTVLAITTAYRVDTVMLLPMINLCPAISSLVARSCGEGSPEKIKTYFGAGMGMMVSIAVVLTLVMYWFGAYFVAFFGVDGSALAEGRAFFQDISLFYVLFGIALVFRSVLEGIGDVTYCSIMGIAVLALRIGFSYLLEPVLEERSIAFAEGIAWTLLLLLLGIRFWYKRRMILPRKCNAKEDPLSNGAARG